MVFEYTKDSWLILFKLPLTFESFIPCRQRYRFSSTLNYTIVGWYFDNLEEKCRENRIFRNDIDQFGLIFAGAQKNAGPAGVTVVIARKDWIAANANPNLPLMFQYDKHMKEDSMLNTCPTFSIYLLGLTAQWLLDQGGVAAIEARNQAKAHALYNYIDANDFYTACVNGSSRSLMNVCFKTPSESLDTEFHKRAAEAGFIGLKGHRLVGGLRASIYNAMPSAGVDQLIGFMDEFRKR